MHLRPRPPEVVLLQQENDKQGGLGNIDFPKAGSFLRIRPDVFANEDPDEIRSIHWAASCARLVAATTLRLWAVPIERGLDAPRHRASDGRKIRKL